MSTVDDILELAAAPAAKPLVPTAEQQAIINLALHSRENILINALAGAAKTSTLEMICKALPLQPILFLAFNKRIAEEAKKRLPGHIMVKTMNAVGHGIWAQACARRLVVDTKKSYTLLKELVDALPRQQKSAAYETFSDTLKAVARAKSIGYVPEGLYPHAKRLGSLSDFLDSFEEEPEVDQIQLINEVLNKSIQLAYAGQIDFDDQIYMPTLFGGTFPQFPLVMVDEAQDLSNLNHAMLRKLVSQRLIAVGDERQSIYAFRGAATGGMASLRDQYSMTEMPLSTSFRCPRVVVERARWRAPHMTYPDWAIEGVIHDRASPESSVARRFTTSDIGDTVAIICRNNAPLFSLGFRLIRAGRGIQLVGLDIGPGLVKVLKSLGDIQLTQREVHKAINAWETERLKKAKGKATTADRAECLRVFASMGDTLGAAITYAEHLFSQRGPIQLLSGHKAKGLEWDTVFHLDPWRIPSPWVHSDEDLEQEKNIRYVIETRAKRELWLVNSEDFVP